MNKISNKYVWLEIKKLIQSSDDGIDKFYFIQSIIKNEKSLLVRERICRERVLQILKDELKSQNYKKAGKWTRIIYNISRYSKYFINYDNNQQSIWLYLLSAKNQLEKNTILY